MNFYKIVNTKGNYGIFWKNGINEDQHDFIYPYGIYYAKEYIFNWSHLGDEVYIINTLSQQTQHPKTNPIKYRSKKVEMIFFGKLNDPDTIKMMVNDGVILTSQNNKLIKVSAKNGWLNNLIYFHSIGIDLTMNNSYLFRIAAKHNRLETMKYLYSIGCESDSVNNNALKLATLHNNKEVISYLSGL